MVNYGLPGVIWPMIGLLVIQIIAVYFLDVEPALQHWKGSIGDRKRSRRFPLKIGSQSLAGQ